MKLIKRTEYLDRLISLNNTPDIKVITGIRRCGKSELVKAYIKYLKKAEPSANIIFINLQELENDELKEYHRLHSYITDHYKKGKHNVLIIDEVQLCPQFELTINSLHAKGGYDIYVTGSNAFLLSSDLSTLFTGRTMEVEVFPFSFREYLQYFKPKEEINRSFDQYVRTGGLPGAYVYEDEKQRYDYVKEVYQTILERDLVRKYKIRNKEEFFRIADFMMDNISNLLSVNNICESLNAEKSQITNKTVSNYIGYLENAFLFYKAMRYDLRGKKYLKSNHKFYLSDPSIRYAILGTRNMDYGRVYENVVYMELLRRGYDVYVGKLYKKEIDFVATRQNEKLYIQVSDDISGEKTFKREYGPLLAISDAYPKMIIARTRHEQYDNQGIVVQDLAEWLNITKKNRV